MSLTPFPRLPRGSTDWAWGGLGVGMATASATFATYMIVTAPAEVTGFGSKDFGIFARFDRRPAAQVAAAMHPPVSRAAEPARPAAPVTVATASGAAIDREPTGSIPDPADRTIVSRDAGRLPDFRVRDVVGDHALIEHQKRLSVVRPGSILAGAGEVLSIERRDGIWVVRTAAGTIGGS